MSLAEKLLPDLLGSARFARYLHGLAKPPCIFRPPSPEHDIRDLQGGLEQDRERNVATVLAMDAIHEATQRPFVVCVAVPTDSPRAGIWAREREHRKSATAVRTPARFPIRGV